MASFLLDTNVLLHLVNKAEGWQHIEQKIDALQGKNLCVSAITVWEINRMAVKAKVKKVVIAAVFDLLAICEVIPLTDQYAALSGSLHAQLSNKGLTIGERDSMIAGTALALGFIVVTDNAREFNRVPGLVIENWRKSEK